MRRTGSMPSTWSLDSISPFGHLPSPAGSDSGPVGNLSVLTPTRRNCGFPTTIRVDPFRVPPGLQPPEFVAPFATGSLDTSDGGADDRRRWTSATTNEGAPALRFYGRVPGNTVCSCMASSSGRPPAITCSGPFPAHCEAGEMAPANAGTEGQVGSGMRFQCPELNWSNGACRRES